MWSITLTFFLLFPTVQFFTSAICFFCFYMVGQKVTYEFKWRYLRALLLQDKQWFDNVQVEKLPTEFHYNLDAIEDAAGKSIGIILTGVGSLISGLITMFYFGYLFALFTCIIFSLMISIFFFQLRITSKAEKREKEEFEMSGSESEQALNAIRVVKAYGQESSEITRFESHLEKGKSKFCLINSSHRKRK